jgi:hypothetical protein
VALGPVPLIEITNSIGGKIQYRTAAPEVIGSAFTMAYGPQLEERLQEIFSRLTVIAEAMTAGRHAFARIAAVQMRLPEFAAEGFANGGTNAEINKYNPRWDIEPRDWHGRWMGDNSGPVIPVMSPIRQSVCRR